MIKVRKQTIRKKEVEKLFRSFKKNDLLEDRSEYSEEDLLSTYPDLNEKEAKLLYLKLQQWRYSKKKGKGKIAPSHKNLS
ncbi:MAG: hypothetical protein QW727_02435 [Candidatus Pacearchaeota archaeon]